MVRAIGQACGYRPELVLKEQALLHIVPCVIFVRSLHVSECQSLIAQ